MNTSELEKIAKRIELNSIQRAQYLKRRLEGRTLIKHIPLELQKKRGPKPKKQEDKKPKIIKEKLKAGRKIKNTENYDINGNNFKIVIKKPTEAMQRKIIKNTDIIKEI